MQIDEQVGELAWIDLYGFAFFSIPDVRDDGLVGARQEIGNGKQPPGVRSIALLGRIDQFKKDVGARQRQAGRLIEDAAAERAVDLILCFFLDDGVGAAGEPIKREFFTLEQRPEVIFGIIVLRLGPGRPLFGEQRGVVR